MREKIFQRPMPAEVHLPPLLTTAKLMQWHIKSVNGFYQGQDPLIDNSLEHKAAVRKRLNPPIWYMLMFSADRLQNKKLEIKSAFDLLCVLPQ